MFQCGKKIEAIPDEFKNIIPKNCGSWVINYLRDEYSKRKYTNPNEECNCWNMYHLPCRHMFAKFSFSTIDVPKQYLRMCWNNSTINENKPNHCIIETVDLKTKIPDITELSIKIRSMKNSSAFQQKLANIMLEFIENEENEKNEKNTTKQIGCCSPGQRTHLSKNCEKWKKKSKLGNNRKYLPQKSKPESKQEEIKNYCRIKNFKYERAISSKRKLLFK